MAKYTKGLTKEDKAIFQHLKPMMLTNPWESESVIKPKVDLLCWYGRIYYDDRVDYYSADHFKDYLPAYVNVRRAVMNARAFAGFSMFEIPTMLANALSREKQHE